MCMWMTSRHEGSITHHITVGESQYCTYDGGITHLITVNESQYCTYDGGITHLIIVDGCYQHETLFTSTCAQKI